MINERNSNGKILSCLLCIWKHMLTHVLTHRHPSALQPCCGHRESYSTAVEGKQFQSLAAGKFQICCSRPYSRHSKVCVCVCVMCSMCASTWSNTQSLSRDPDGARGPPTKSVSWFSGWNQEKGAASSGGRSTRSAMDKEEEITKSGHRHFDDETYRNETVYKKASGVTESL